MSNRLAGKVAIVTGAGHGIGLAYARRLASEGASVVIAEIDGDAADKAAKVLSSDGFSALATTTNVIEPKSLEEMTSKTLEKFGRIDILVNNAAIFSTIPMSRSPFDEIEIQEWDAMMAVNVKGAWLASRAVTPTMKNQMSGKIINISSGTALKGSASRIHYVTSKAAILGFTKTLAREVGPFNINVNCVAPGSTLSEQNPDEEILAFRKSGANDRAIKRVENPEDLVGAVAFFASPDSDFITGQTLVVDGGSFMH
ncbi:MAG: 3-oxoacyl-ACP reductase FabG [Actinobacteria bacterium]|nr:3-oxoacyl-ACP reductase FabG [Actinomycetota bacterium]